MHKGILYALLAAITFGASTPLAQILLVKVAPVAPLALAGLLYLGSGLGLLIWFLLRSFGAPKDAGSRLKALDLPWLAAAIVFGGIAGPVLLMFGLTRIPAAQASLLLNLEGVLTALLAWFVFKENFDRKILLGMLLILAGGCVLVWQQWPAAGEPWRGLSGALAIVGACLCWGIDNNLTRKVAGSDAVQIAGVKGLVAGAVNLSLALTLGISLPPMTTMLIAGVLGFCGYGLSLVLFVLALRHLGSARTGAYFSAAPFVGAGVSMLLLQQLPANGFWLAICLMAAGIVLHLIEKHEHPHAHDAVEHSHQHSHGLHHQHEHEHDYVAGEPHTHTHPHKHEALEHAHPHFPDTEHRHKH